MDQPLWQNYLNSIFLAFAVLPAGVALALGVSPPALRVACIAVCVACAIAAVAIWGKRAWVIGSLALVAITFTLATVAALALAPASTHGRWLAQLVVVLAGSAGLIMLAHREGEHDRHA
jgi:peptidoglycan/LPS O-acetylase OafA/YrhL